MDSVVVALILLLVVTVSGPLARLTRLPLPLVQIGLGMALSLSDVRTVALQPSIFFLLFLPPLLFLDGWRIPKRSLFHDRAVIVELALGLVVFTVLGLGFVIHWLIPGVPLPVAFALAAVISPTDPVALSAIAARAPLPKRMMHILEGESLLNDASGLVCLRFAVGAMLTGAFSLPDAVTSFLWVAFGGLAIGAGVTWLVTAAKAQVSASLGEDASTQVLISLLLPFGAYLAAESVHCSGILAAVAAGIAMSYAEQSGQALGVTRVRRTAVWDSVQFAANGVIFVLLGAQLPGIVADAPQTVRLTGHENPWWLALYALAITLALAALRFAWVWMSLRFTLFRARRRGEPARRIGLRLLMAMSLAGVRGAITLAGVLTLPLTLRDGSPFPARDLAILLAAGVIVSSLLVASIGLPRILKGVELPPEPSRQADEDKARTEAAKAAIPAIEQAQHVLAEAGMDADLTTDTAARLMELYRQRIDSRAHGPEAAEAGRKADVVERRLRLAGLRAERDAIFRLGRYQQIDEETARKLVRELDLLEARYTG